MKVRTPNESPNTVVLYDHCLGEHGQEEEDDAHDDSDDDNDDYCLGEHGEGEEEAD